jgi:elongation factor P--(R)-beta-lysine ligase
VTETSPPRVFPSELEPQTSALYLAGRVVRVETDALWLSDAFAAARVRGSFEVDVGDLVVVSVRREGSELVAAGLVEHHRPRRTSRDEQHRFQVEGVGQNLRARATAFAAARSFFTSRNFLEVDTPELVPSPGLDLHLDAIDAAGGYLITSPEYQMKRLLAGGLPRIFQLCHVFRQGEVGARHNPEFTMLEWYRAFAGVEEVMRDTEELVGETFFLLAGRTFERPFARLSVKDAFLRFATVSEGDFFALAANDTESFFRILVDRVEPAIASLGHPVFLIDYPLSQASLARPNPADPRVCERFELYVGGVELCNGFGELTDPVEQRRRLLADQRTRASLGKPVYPIDERFLAALEEGMPPSAGNALGLDRLVALALGEPDIARVMPFPAALI